MKSQPGMSKLYRGVSKTTDKENDGKILPKGTHRKIAPKFGDSSFRFDGKFFFGESENNTARAHQVESGRHGGCAISTTRDFEEAKKFTTSGNIEAGFVYVFDENSLAKYGVDKYEFTDPEYPHEREVTLITRDCNALPIELIEGKYEILPFQNT